MKLVSEFLIVLSFSLVSISAFAQNNSQTAAELPDQLAEEQKKSQSTDLQKATDKVVEVAKEANRKVTETLSETRLRRQNADYYLLGNYSLFDLLIPSKYGFSLGYIQNVDTSWEFEYLKGTVSVPFVVEDLGKMSDERFSIIRRSYFGGNSFNLSYGVSYFDFSLHLGDKLLSRVTSGSHPSIDLIEVQSLGLNIGVGNRWSFNKNITVGIDWISWAQPIFVTKKSSEYLKYANNQEDKDDVDTAMKIISYFPRLAFMKIQFGILF